MGQARRKRNTANDTHDDKQCKKNGHKPNDNDQN